MKIAHSLILTLLILAAAGTANAQGILIPDPTFRYGKPIALDSHRVEVFIKNQRASTTVQQVFSNNSRQMLEATYYFPIPESASVADFTMWVNGQEMKAELVDADRARQIYTDIVRRMRDPGLLEYAGQDLIRMRVFPVQPGGDVRIEIVYHQVLKFDAGLVEYRYPTLSRCRANLPPEEFSFTARVESDQDIKSLYCPSYDVDRELGRNDGELGFEGRGAELDGDFVIFYSVSAEEVGMSLVTSQDGRDDGHFMLLVSPGRLEGARRSVAKDVVFVVDRSGSMKGEKIKQTRDALRYCLDQLNQRDRFGLVTFATSVHTYEDRLVKASDSELKRAHRYVDGIEARGGTDIAGALEAALDMFHGDRPRYVIFLTDGLPTVGTTNVGNILDDVARRAGDELRLFSFGVGYDVNTRLLDRLSGDNRGVVTYVAPEERIGVKVSSFYSKVSEPVLTDVVLDFGDAEVSDVFPRRMPDLFNGEQLVVVGRYEKSTRATLLLSGMVDDDMQAFEFNADFSGGRDFDFVPRIWATRYIGYLLEQLRDNRHDQELIDEITDLAMRYGVVTPYTSYLILESDDMERLGFSDARELFDNYSDNGDRDAPTQLPMPQAMSSESGRASVQLSDNIAQSKRKETVGRVQYEAVRVVGAKTFFFDGDTWIDGEYDEAMEVTEVEFLTEAYFEFAADHPEAAPYLALGERVIFVLDGRAYRISS